MKAIILIITVLISSTTIANNPITERGMILMLIDNDKISCFINSIWSDAKRIEQEYGVPMSLTIAQACLESGYGSSTLAKNNCNFFGLRRNHKWMNYDSKYECFSHYGRTLTQSCYKNLQPFTLQEWYAALECCGYATSKTYTKKLNQIIFMLNLDLLSYEGKLF